MHTDQMPLNLSYPCESDFRLWQKTRSGFDFSPWRLGGSPPPIPEIYPDPQRGGICR